MKNLVSTLFIALVGISTSAEANPPPYHQRMTIPSLPQAQAASPAELLDQGLQRMRDFLAEGGADDPARLYTFLEEEIAPYFDFERMAAWVSRPYYQQMTDRQRTRFRSRLKEVFLQSLARQIGTFSDPQPRIAFLRPQRTGPNEVTASARVLSERGYPVRLKFRFRGGEEGWKVVDTAANGVSAVHHYRHSFLTRVRRYGLQSVLR